MAEVYSNNYNTIEADGTGYNARAVGSFFAPTGYGRGELSRKVGRVTVPLAASFGAIGDTVSFLDLKSGDRLVELLMSMDANQGATVSDWDIGLYKSSVTTIGDLVTADTNDMFAAAADLTGTALRVDRFKLGATTFLDMDRGLALWELVNLVTASTYESDPFETWTLAATSTDATVATATAAHVWQIEAIYVPGG
jgi:hypothetical protein